MDVIKLVPTEYFGSNTYIIISGSQAAVIDPSIDFDEAMEKIGNSELTFKYIFVTHAHFDHIYSIDSWVNATDAEVIVGAQDAAALSDAEINCYSLFMNRTAGYYGEYRTVAEGDHIQIGSEILYIMLTPGHTPGSISLLTDKEIFVGDVIFAGGGYGRFDLPGGDARILVNSIKRLTSLSQDLVVYSGHGNKTTIREYKRNFL